MAILGHAGPIEADHHHAHPHHHKPAIRLVLYPGETVSGGVTTGRIYVVGGHGESYEMAGGPPPGKGFKHKNEGGHSAGVTPAGHYTLGHKEHHTTINWPSSVIPWGAPLREHDGEVQYLVGSTWHTATGRLGTVTQAQMLFLHRSGEHPRWDDVIAKVRRAFYLRDGITVVPIWVYNDFGNWAWNLHRHGKRSPYYIHTTPRDEWNADAMIALTQSHGCIHIHPADRDDMMGKHYLEAGIEVEVKRYGRKGPP